MATFLFKTEPGEYSFADLTADKRTTWSGVRNAAALGHLRTAKKGDQAFIYHTGDERSIVGLAEITTAPYPDPDQPATDAPPGGPPKFAVVDLKPLKPCAKPVTLAALKSDPRFTTFALIRQSRLSIMPVPPTLDRIIRDLAGLPLPRG